MFSQWYVLYLCSRNHVLPFSLIWKSVMWMKKYKNDRLQIWIRSTIWTTGQERSDRSLVQTTLQLGINIVKLYLKIMFLFCYVQYFCLWHFCSCKCDSWYWVYYDLICKLWCNFQIIICTRKKYQNIKCYLQINWIV